GDGSFQGPMSYPVGNAARAVAVGGFNGGGAPDLAGTTGYTRGAGTVLVNGADLDAGAPNGRAKARVRGPPRGGTPCLGPGPLVGPGSHSQVAGTTPPSSSAHGPAGQPDAAGASGYEPKSTQSARGDCGGHARCPHPEVPAYRWRGVGQSDGRCPG